MSPCCLDKAFRMQAATHESCVNTTCALDCNWDSTGLTSASNVEQRGPRCEEAACLVYKGADWCTCTEVHVQQWLCWTKAVSMHLRMASVQPASQPG